MCYTKHDSARVVTEGQAAAGGKRVFVVQLMLGDLTRSTNFTAVEGPSGRWYVESLDLEPLSAFCAKGGGD